eukprot:31063-Pelagococcus_subviridis.AAC.11
MWSGPLGFGALALASETATTLLETARKRGAMASRARLCRETTADPVSQLQCIPSGRSALSAASSAPIAGRTSRAARSKSSAVTTTFAAAAAAAAFSFSFSFSFSFLFSFSFPEAARYRASACDCAAPTRPLISAPL